MNRRSRVGHDPGARARRQVAAWTWLLAGLVALLAAEAAAPLEGTLLDRVAGDFVTNVVLLLASLTLLARGALVAHERTAWLLLGAGALAWSVGDIYYTFALPQSGEVPFPTVADAFYLAFYPFAYAALGLLVRSRVARFSRVVWADGLIAALAVGSVAAAAVFEVVRDATGGRPLAVAVNLAYPLADGLLLGIVVAALALTGWRSGGGWSRLMSGIALFAVADSIFLWQTARGTYATGGVLDDGWVAGIVLLATAALVPPAPAQRRRAIESAVALVVPGLFALVPVGVLAVQAWVEVGPLAIVLAVATLAVAVVRMTLTVIENHRMLVASRREAVTDALTKLGNRRALERAFDELVELGTPPRVLILYDLDGFKRYNDAFGHLAGDALLARLAGRLQTALDGRGEAFRMGGDEFCVLAACRPEEAETAGAALAAALREEGKGFRISASWGAVSIPGEARSYVQALRLADGRMYARKGMGRTAPEIEASNVLVRAIAERDGNLGDHLNGVAELADAVAASLGLVGEERQLVRIAALVHDVGKVAVPDAILQKPAPLTPDERAFVERHTEIGEKILLASPSLTPVARIVRSSHERWDGAGYPDRLLGEEIPLASRIVFVCDAYDAMVSRRPYSEPIDVEVALGELERCAGSQFDPMVTEAFCRVVRGRASELTRIVEGRPAAVASGAVPAADDEA